MPSPQLLTMIVPVRNRAHLLDGVIGSIRQSWDEGLRFNLVIVDNGSTDNAPARFATELLPHAPQGVDARIVNEPRPGACRARNRGLREVTTPYVMFFDSDDRFAPGHMRRILATLRNAGANASQLYVWDVNIPGGTHNATPAMPSLRHHLFHCSLSTQRYCCSTALIRSVGGWNEDLPVWNDFELGVRLLLATPSVHKIEGEPLVDIIPVADSITGTRLSHRAAERAMALDAIEDALTAAGKRELIRYVNVRRMILSALCRCDGVNADVGRQQRTRATRSAAGIYEQLALNTVYFVQRIFGRFGSPVGELIL